MNDNMRSKEDLIGELNYLRKRNLELETILDSIPLSTVLINATDGKFPYMDRNAMELCGTDCAGFNKELLENQSQLEDDLADTKLLQSISTALIQQDNIQGLYEKIIEAAKQIMHSQFASVQMLRYEHDSRGELHLLAFSGFTPEAAEFWRTVGMDCAASTCAEALRTTQRIIISDVEQCHYMQGTEDLAMYRQTGIRACQTTPLLSRSGRLVGMLSTHWSNPYQPSERELRIFDLLARQLADLIERKLAEETLRESEKEKIETLKRAIEMKDEFLSLVSHEFKTPLTVINSAIQAMRLICKNELSEKANEFLNKILQNSNRQLKLVNNLLDITHINANHIKINRSNVDIVSFTRFITDSIRVFADQKSIRLTFSSTLQKKEIGIDEEKWERILLNLLSNAVKFTSKGKSISVRVYQKIMDRKSKVCIQVEDQGMGIPLDKQQLIFERFGQVDSSLSRQAEGTGIGLSLVKMLVELMGGEIRVESIVGRGSTFTVILPVGKIKESPSEKILKKISDNRLIQATAIEFSDVY